ncbi:hypothetical protein D3C83_111100 [compost metagenome]
MSLPSIATAPAGSTRAEASIVTTIPLVTTSETARRPVCAETTVMKVTAVTASASTIRIFIERLYGVS